MSNKNRQTPHANQKRENTLALYLLSSIYIALYIYTLRNVEHKVLRYILLNLNKLNITDVIYLSLTTVP